MTTNLLIGYPQITEDSTVTASSAFSSDLPVTNLIYGARASLARTASNTTTQAIKFDTGSSTARTIEFFYIADAGILQGQGSKMVGLTGSDDDSSYADIAVSGSGFQSKTLYGPESNDLIWTAEIADYDTGSLPYSTARRYYKAHLAGSGTCPSKKYAASKVMFGQWFDFGQDPEFDGVAFRSQGRKSATVLSFVWRGITIAKRNDAENYLFKNREKGVILYTKSYHAPLFDYRVLHCFISSYDVRAVTYNSFDISITFREQT